MSLIRFLLRDKVQGYVHMALFFIWFTVLLVGFIGGADVLPSVISMSGVVAVLLQIAYEIWVSSNLNRWGQ